MAKGGYSRNEKLAFVGLTAASAFVGSRIAKNKVKGALIGAALYVGGVFVYMKMKPRIAR